MEDSYAKKKLPYNLNAEKSVIGSMLMDRDAIVDASDMPVSYTHLTLPTILLV